MRFEMYQITDTAMLRAASRFQPSGEPVDRNDAHLVALAQSQGIAASDCRSNAVPIRRTAKLASVTSYVQAVFRAKESAST